VVAGRDDQGFLEGLAPAVKQWTTGQEFRKPWPETLPGYSLSLGLLPGPCPPPSSESLEGGMLKSCNSRTLMMAWMIYEARRSGKAPPPRRDGEPYLSQDAVRVTGPSHDEEVVDVHPVSGPWGKVEHEAG
jgi:hypothetical protein